MRQDFCLCCNDKYVPYAAVTIKSVIANSSKEDEVHIHILSDFISKRNQTRLTKLCNDNIYIHIRIVSDTTIIKGLVTGVWSIYTWYRLLLPDLLEKDIHRVLYLDCDVLINDNVQSLFTIDLSGKTIAACIDTQAYNKDGRMRLGYDYYMNYVCAGVLLINLDKWREEKTHEKIIAFAKANSELLQFPDQDAINVICQNDKILLSPRYGVLVTYFTNSDFIRQYLGEIEGIFDNPAIIHYAGYQPWVFEKNKSPHSSLWWKTYCSLRSFPEVLIHYCESIIKYYVKWFLKVTGIFGFNSKYSTAKYYSHPRITKKHLSLTINKIQAQP
jgi:lipopolysaccharide biosynthesis glycosyltransferase